MINQFVSNDQKRFAPLCLLSLSLPLSHTHTLKSIKITLSFQLAYPFFLAFAFFISTYIYICKVNDDDDDDERTCWLIYIFISVSNNRGLLMHLCKQISHHHSLTIKQRVILLAQINKLWLCNIGIYAYIYTWLQYMYMYVSWIGLSEMWRVGFYWKIIWNLSNFWESYSSNSFTLPINDYLYIYIEYIYI